MTIMARDETLLGSLTHRYEKFTQNAGLGVQQAPMGVADLVLFDDDFSNGRMNGWRPTHVKADVPNSPISIEMEYPIPGLYLATASTPYRANAVANNVATWKGLSGRFPKTGILSFSAMLAIQSGGPGAQAWSSFGLTMDLQNWDSSLRATPTFQWAPAAFPGAPQLQLVNTSGTFSNITGLTNPVTGSTVSSTQFLLAGENEAKWDINYMRVSYDLGNLYTASSGLTSKYYEVNINGYRFDLRTQAQTSGSYLATQGGNTLSMFTGGMNFGVSLGRTNSATLYPARLVAGSTRATFHSQGWLV